jgi:Positive regulator of sigma E activity
MTHYESIEHEGIIAHIEGQHIQVKIVSKSACSECHAKGACSAADLQDKIIDIYQEANGMKPGDKVMISGEKRNAKQAVLLAYVYPMVVVLAVLAIVFQLTDNELSAGVAALASLVPYYLVISLFKNKLKNTFSFQIKHQS